MNVFFQGVQGQALQELTERLWRQNFSVFLAGGCVRDHLLGRPYKDLDVVTDATVEQIQKIFSKTIPVGINFGIVRVIIHGFEFEVAHFRRDGPYVDGRHPEYVEYAGPEEDAFRRDFTVNALFYDLKNNIVLDFVNGQKDLNDSVLRAVGDPIKRFSEDYLRLLRLLRFTCQLHFTVDAQTSLAADQLSSHLTEVSGERLSIEITKALLGDPARALRGFLHWRLPSLFFPFWNFTNSSYLESKGPESEFFLILRGKNSVGWLLSMWMLNFQPHICEQAIDFVSQTEWIYNREFLDKCEDLCKRFKISKSELQVLKETASVLSWQRIWYKFRPGFRGYLSQSTFFEGLSQAALQLGGWESNMLQEVVQWQEKPQVKSFLLGKDVINLLPEKRGLALRESIYLQYEHKLTSREEALEWLNNFNK